VNRDTIQPETIAGIPKIITGHGEPVVVDEDDDDDAKISSNHRPTARTSIARYDDMSEATNSKPGGFSLSSNITRAVRPEVWNPDLALFFAQTSKSRP
jgi:hypothetical protein